jgi:hypothetical protein
MEKTRGDKLGGKDTASAPKAKVEMTQRLPHQLLHEYCKKEKRPVPVYKNISIQPGLYKFRVTLPDPRKNTSKDLQFVSSNIIPDEQQAKEEVCLLALLNLQPAVAHERMLSEPHRTTWINATGSFNKTEQHYSQKSNSATIKYSPTTLTADERFDAGNHIDQSNTGKFFTGNERFANEPTNLQRDTSRASRMTDLQQLEDMWEEENGQQRNSRFRRHEAKRMANQKHQVVMSARMRKCIEQLLRDGTINDIDENKEDWINDTDEDDEDDENDDIKLYVQNRLHNAGFTRVQAFRAYQSIRSQSNSKPITSVDEREWDEMYENCLQWLLINLNEDQLPEGFDPRGFTLDVIVPGAERIVQSNKTNVSPFDSEMTQHCIEISTKFGLTIDDSSYIVLKSKETGKDDIETFWAALQAVCSGSYSTDSAIHVSNIDADEAMSLLIEELETLDVIFGAECAVYNSGEAGFTSIVLPLEEGTLSLEVVVAPGRYPKVLPERICVWGSGWESQPRRVSVAVHVELMKIVSSLPRDEPMIFSIHSQIQDILHSDNLVEISLVPSLDDVMNHTETSDTHPVGESEVSHTIELPVFRQPVLRPRERKKSFWTVAPSQMHAAKSFPKLNMNLEKMRKSLPAAQARDEFLTAMSLASTLGRVLLVTGETGSGTIVFNWFRYVTHVILY